MTVPGIATEFDATPEHALATIEGDDGPVVIDLDETLLLTNSTSLFLDSARPALFVYLVVKLSDLVDKLRKTSSDSHRRRVRAVLTFVPWTRWTWRRRVRRIVPDLLNRPLIEALSRSERPIVVSTKGFSPVVEPIITLSGLRPTKTVAMDPWGKEDRDDAKFRLTDNAVAPSCLDQCLVVTDSLDDRRLLEASEDGLRILWPLAPQKPLFADVYVPGRYLAVKRPNANYLRKIIKEDLAFWILGSVWLASNPLAHVSGLAVLALSFWAVYELGYVDNDRLAERYEHDPTLSDAFHQKVVRVATWKPVVFALLSGAVGLWLLRWPDGPHPTDWLRWGAVLAGTWLVFGTYNRLDKQTRVLLYPLLQLARLGAFLALVPTTAIADMALIVFALLRWVSYFIYRERDKQWPSEDFSAIRLIVFTAGSVLLASQHDWSDLVAPTTISLFVWMLFLSRHVLPPALARAHRIDRIPN